MYVHKTEIRGQDQTSDFTTIQSDERWTPRAPSLKHAWLRNPFSVIYPWSQIKPFLTCVIIERKMEKRSRFYSSSTIHPLTHLCSTTIPLYTSTQPMLPSLPLALYYFVKYKGYGMRVREGMKPTLTGRPSITRLAQINVGGEEETVRRNWSNWRTVTQTPLCLLVRTMLATNKTLCQHLDSQLGLWN